MGVLAVTQRLNQVEVQEQLLVQSGLHTHVCGDMCVILCGVGVCLGRQLDAGVDVGVAEAAYLVQHHVIVAGIADNGDCGEVLGGAAEHGGTAYVDVLNGVLERAAGLGHRGLEGIEVYADHVDGLDAVLLELGHVAGVVATAQQTAVHTGVQSLDAASAYLREARDVADAGGLHAAVLKQLLCAARGDDFPS